MWTKFRNICLTVEENPQKNLNQEIDPTGNLSRGIWIKGNQQKISNIS